MGRKHVNSKKIVVDGIQFASQLEAYCYTRLRDEKIPHEYEGKTFTLVEGFKCPSVSWEFKWGKFRPVKNGVEPITYTPDFVCPDGRWVIECKGRANEQFPIRWKLFKKYLFDNSLSPEIYQPKTTNDVDEMIRLINGLEV